ncbi:MAG: hypothetical protein ABEH56_06855 [Salinirussus sp.]
MTASDLDGPDDESRRATVTAHESSPGRVVFTETENSEGWIATDYVVEIDR